MRIPDEMTIGESYGPAMAITEQEEADEYFEALVERNMRITGNERDEAERVERSNLGYYSGYYDAETAKRAMRLFQCVHPVFGLERPSAEEAFTKGLAAGKAALRKSIWTEIPNGQ